MTHDSSALIAATIIGILTTYLVFCLEDILLGGIFSDTVNISLALFIGGTTHLLVRYFLLKKARPRNASSISGKPPHHP